MSGTSRAPTSRCCGPCARASTGQLVDTRELAAIVERFEAIAYEHVLAHGGRIVKIIGDEVMFCADDSKRAAEIALAVVEAHARDDDLPEIRVGLASGPTLA